jgi:hypothetical protein
MAFNLVCIGSEYTGPSLAESLLDGPHQAPYAVIYRVDLSRMRYCFNECDRTYPLASVSESEIVFRRGADVGPGAAADSVERVNRENGRFIEMFVRDDRAMVTVRRGTCQRAEFEGLPNRLF